MHLFGKKSQFSAVATATIVLSLMTLSFFEPQTFASNKRQQKTPRTQKDSRGEEIVKELEQALRSKDFGRSVAILDYIATEDDTRLMGKVVAILAQSPRDYNYELSLIGDKHPDLVLPILDHRLSEEPEADVEPMIVGNIGAYHPTKALPILFKALKHKGDNARYLAVQALNHVLGANQNPDVTERLSEEQHRQIQSAILVCLKNDPRWEIRHDAAQFLRNPEYARDHVSELKNIISSNKEDIRVKLVVIQALGNYGSVDEYEFTKCLNEAVALSSNPATDESGRYRILSDLILAGEASGHKSQVLKEVIAFYPAFSTPFRTDLISNLRGYEAELAAFRPQVNGLLAAETEKRVKDAWEYVLQNK